MLAKTLVMYFICSLLTYIYCTFMIFLGYTYFMISNKYYHIISYHTIPYLLFSLLTFPVTIYAMLFWQFNKITELPIENERSMSQEWTVPLIEHACTRAELMIFRCTEASRDFIETLKRHVQNTSNVTKKMKSRVWSGIMWDNVCNKNGMCCFMSMS